MVRNEGIKISPEGASAIRGAVKNLRLTILSLLGLNRLSELPDAVKLIKDPAKADASYHAGNEKTSV